jgi:hypothetical protein
MATRQIKVQQTPEVTPMPDGWQMVTNASPDEIEEDDEESSPVDRVIELLRAGGAERAKVKLYRFGPKGEEFCTEYQPEDFESIGLDGIREQWGSGQFVIRVYGTAPGSQKYARRASQNITIAEVKTPIHAPQQNTEIARVFESIQKNQEMMLKAITERPPAPDPMSEMTKMLSMMTMMREAMGLNQQPQQKSSIGEIVDAIKELQGAKSLIEGKEEKEETLMGMLPQVLDVIKTGMSQQAAPQTLQQMPVVHLPQSIASAESVQQPIQPQETTDMIKPTVIARLLKDKMHIEKMIAEKTSTLDAANWIVDSASDELVAVLITDEWFEGLLSVMPAAKEHEAWLKETRVHAMELLKSDGFFDQTEWVAITE